MFLTSTAQVEKPVELAELLLNDPSKWSRQNIISLIKSGQTRTVFLPKELPVLLFYWTVLIDKDGSISFRKDVYGRDKAVLKGLDGEFKLRDRPLAG